MAKILVCDDALFMRMTIKDTLEAAGHHVVGEAKNVKESIKLFKELKPDLVTMDMLMDRSGTEAIKNIIKVNPKAKIVIVSVLNNQESEVVDAVKHGAQGLVTKPIKRESLVAEVERVLEL